MTPVQDNISLPTSGEHRNNDKHYLSYLDYHIYSALWSSRFAGMQILLVMVHVLPLGTARSRVLLKPAMYIPGSFSVVTMSADHLISSHRLFVLLHCEWLVFSVLSRMICSIVKMWYNTLNWLNMPSISCFHPFLQCCTMDLQCNLFLGDASNKHHSLFISLFSPERAYSEKVS